MISEQFVVMPDDEDLEGFSFMPDLILIFISPSFSNLSKLKKYRKKYPDCIITGCSTAGEIEDISVHFNSAVVTGIAFDKSSVVYNQVKLQSVEDSNKAGSELVSKFEQENLKHLYVLSEGININGTDFVEGLTHHSSSDFSITGGLAADGFRSENTFVLTNDFSFVSNIVVGIGFYGDDLRIGFGSLNGLNSLGVDRIVTKSSKNIVYEIDDEPANELLSRLIGVVHNEIQGSSIMLPLAVREKVTDRPVVRTIKSVNANDGSILFSGNIKEGSYIRLMKSNIDRIINAAEGAAEVSIEPIGNTHTDLALITSCIARRLVLKGLVEEEIVAVRDVVGEDATIAGFYSYGEISPNISNDVCELQNQSIVVTTFSESDIE